jgi:small redox-active disulfide protein 2
MRVTIYGPGCAKCHEAEQLAREVLAELGREAQVEKVTEFQAMAKAGVLAPPAVAVDGALKCSGRVPARKELLAWLG